MNKKTKKPTFASILIYLVTLRWLFVGLVYFYKLAISPLLPSACIHYPTCSTYMIQAINEHGVVRGIVMGVWRIMRCNPMSEGGFDPVPDNPKGDMKWLF